MTILSGQGFKSSKALTSSTWTSDQVMASPVRPQVAEDARDQAPHASSCSPSASGGA